jgi:hypothetical protein
MKVVIAGTRSIHSLALIQEAVLESGFTVTTLLEGGADGVDRAARHWAKSQGIPFETHEAAWGKWGKMAGPMRNTKMAQLGQALVAIWDGKSAGTYDMITKMQAEGKPVYVLNTQTWKPNAGLEDGLA